MDYDPMMMEMGMYPPTPTKQPAKAPEQVVDPNQLVADPNAVTIQKARVSQSSKRATPQTAEELSIEYQAGKELEYAETFINLAKKRAQTYKKGVDLCRVIIQKYPGTKYEDAARSLLREVPEHKRKTYRITDEELRLP